MVSAPRVEEGSQVLSASIQKTIQSIKEIVGNHSDTEIYHTLKESNMDPNETAQKLLNQDPFHEVRRRKDKKKESAGNDNSTDQRIHSEVVDQRMRVNTYSDRNARRGYARSALPGVSREFRVVRDNRVNRDTNKEAKPASTSPATSYTENASGKGSVGGSKSEKPSVGKNSSQGFNGSSDSHERSVQDSGSACFVRKEASEEKRVSVPSAAPRVQVGKANNNRPQSVMVASSSSAVGVYSSSTDPVHVPSPDSRSSGAIKREVGVVGVRRQSSDNSKSSVSGSSFSNTVLRGEGSTEPFRSFTNVSKSNEPNQTSEPMMPNMSVSRPLLGGGHYSNRQPHQPPVGHQKASQPNKEWKPKSSQKPRSPGVIGSPTKSVSSPANDSKKVDLEMAKVQDKVARLSIHENQNVIIAQHIRVPETDRCQLTFGSFGKDFDPISNLVNGFQGAVAVGESIGEPAASLSAPESSIDDASSSKQVDLIDENLRNSGTNSPRSGAASENQLPDKKESSSPRNLDNYADIGLVQDNTPSYGPSDSHRQEQPDLPGFSAYDATSYDIPYFRPTVDDSMRGQGLQIHQEAFSHNVNAPTSTIAMVQQQQQQQQPPPSVAQMYPQVHVPHYANLMPYRQFLSPVYVPPMAMPGYSNSPAYPHPSNGNGYVLMPGGGSHMNANSLKYGVQQFKPVPAASPTGFGSFSSPNGYAINPPGVVGGGTGMDDSSRLKYKDGNIYLPNPQGETSELWIPNGRDMQSGAYYNMGQSPHGYAAAAASYNAAQSSHMQQFPGGMYHPAPQPANHHMAATPPPSQLSPYQQQQQQQQQQLPQLGHHLNWNF